jgi:hypothetical protein
VGLDFSEIDLLDDNTVNISSQMNGLNTSNTGTWKIEKDSLILSFKNSSETVHVIISGGHMILTPDLFFPASMAKDAEYVRLKDE